MLNQTSTPKEASKAQLLRAALLDYIECFDDPILKALQGSGLSLVEVVVIWAELYEQVQAAHDAALLQGGSINEAIEQAEEKKQEIAARLLAARKEGA